jgi:hypothetical protein
MRHETDQGVATRKCNNVLITQSHLDSKDLPQVVRACKQAYSESILKIKKICYQGNNTVRIILALQLNFQLFTFGGIRKAALNWRLCLVLKFNSTLLVNKV